MISFSYKGREPINQKYQLRSLCGCVRMSSVELVNVENRVPEPTDYDNMFLIWLLLNCALQKLFQDGGIHPTSNA